MSVEKVTHVAVPAELFVRVISYVTTMPTGAVPFAHVKDMVDDLRACQPVEVHEPPAAVPNAG